LVPVLTASKSRASRCWRPAMVKLDEAIGPVPVTREELHAEIAALKAWFIATFAELAATVTHQDRSSVGFEDEEEASWPRPGYATLKQAHFDTGYSESGIRSMIARKIVTSVKRGGKIWVKLDTVPTGKCEKA
jgi:hypothetical protein